MGTRARASRSENAAGVCAEGANAAEEDEEEEDATAGDAAGDDDVADTADAGWWNTGTGGGLTCTAAAAARTLGLMGRCCGLVLVFAGVCMRPALRVVCALISAR